MAFGLTSHLPGESARFDEIHKIPKWPPPVSTKIPNVAFLGFLSTYRAVR